LTCFEFGQHFLDMMYFQPQPIHYVPLIWGCNCLNAFVEIARNDKSIINTYQIICYQVNVAGTSLNFSSFLI
jgi:hypothetical protein